MRYYIPHTDTLFLPYTSMKDVATNLLCNQTALESHLVFPMVDSRETILPTNNVDIQEVEVHHRGSSRYILNQRAEITENLQGPIHLSV